MGTRGVDMKKCHVQKCDEPVYGAVPMPTDTDAKELWYYCKEHYEIFGSLNLLIDKMLGIKSNGGKIAEEGRRSLSL